MDASVSQRMRRYRSRQRIGKVYLGDSNDTVSVYAEFQDQEEINGDLPLVACFDLPHALTEEQFEGLREVFELEFQDPKTMAAR
jgi:hypothetical protein